MTYRLEAPKWQAAVAEFGAPALAFRWVAVVVASLAVSLTGCGSSRYEPALGAAPNGMTVTPSSGDYVVELADQRPLPTENWNVVLQQGTGRELTEGSGVSLDYELYSWSSSELVEDSAVFDQGVLQANLDPSAGLPDSVVAALVGQKAGVEVLAVLAAGSSEIPDYLDSDDGYYLRVVAR